MVISIIIISISQMGKPSLFHRIMKTECVYINTHTLIYMYVIYT